MSKSTEIGLRLKAARKAAAYRTACAFANAHDIPVSTYSQHENGKRVLNADMLLQYSELLSISPGWLLSGVGEPYMDGVGVVEKKDIIERELYSLDAKMLPSTTMAPIENDIAWVDMKLFNEVLLRFVPLLQDTTLCFDTSELMSFATEVYNGVIMTSAKQSDKLAMIDLSITSLKRGALKQSNIVPVERKSA